MKFRKLFSLLTSAAVTASCAAGMLISDVYAEYTLSPVTVTSESGAELSIAGYLGSMSGRTAKSLSKKIVFDSDNGSFDVRLSKKDLIAMRDDTVCKKYEFTITDDHNFKYKAVIDQESIPADSSLIPESGISLALTFTSGSYEVMTASGKETVKYVDVRNTGALGGVTVSYCLIGERFGELMNAYGISTALDLDLLVPYTGSDGKTRYSLEGRIYAATDALFTLTGDQTSYKRIAFDPYSEYFKKSAAEKLISASLGEKIGYTEDELEKKADVIADTVAEIKESLTNRYYSRDEINEIVNEYLAESKNLKALISDILKESTNQKAIYEAVYSVFGESTSSYQADKIAEFISDDLIGKLYAELINDNEFITDTYSGRIKFFLNQYARDILIDLKKQVSEVQQKSGIEAQNITQALEMISTGSKQEQQEQKVQQEIIPDASENTNDQTAAERSAYELAVEKGFDGTITEWFNSLADNRAYELAVSDGYTGTPEQWISALAVSTGRSAYEQAAARGYKGSFDRWISLIAGEAASSEKDKKDETLPAVQGFYEWATENYGSMDAFMAAIAEIAQKNVTRGESAYEIAVRNGFVGTEQEWLRSLAGESAYDIAVRNGFNGTEQEWLESLRGRDGKDGEDGKTIEENRVIYMYGYNQQGAPESPAIAGQDTVGDEIVIDNTDELSTPVTVINGNDTQVKPTAGNTNQPAVGNTNQPASGSTTVNTEDNKVAATAGNTRASNPTTGTAAAVLIPAAAVSALLLLRKDKRRRGRR